VLRDRPTDAPPGSTEVPISSGHVPPGAELLSFEPLADTWHGRFIGESWSDRGATVSISSPQESLLSQLREVEPTALALSDVTWNRFADVSRQMIADAGIAVHVLDAAERSPLWSPLSAVVKRRIRSRLGLGRLRHVVASAVLDSAAQAWWATVGIQITQAEERGSQVHGKLVGHG
jgi:long-subunit acyl-CoA synthetase (AMP-forming)